MYIVTYQTFCDDGVDAESKSGQINIVHVLPLRFSKITLLNEHGLKNFIARHDRPGAAKM